MAAETTVLAFDLGAGSGRAYVGQLQAVSDDRRILKIEEVHRFPNHAIHVGGHLHWDILRLLHETKTGIRRSFQLGFTPGTFGIDTWGVDFGLLDGNGELLGNPYHYRDTHTEGLIEEVSGIIGQDVLFEQSGLQFMPFNTLYQLYAMKKANSPKLDIADTLLLTPDLLIYLLTGRKSCEYTMATTTQLFHPELQNWNFGLMDQLGIPSRIFQTPVHPGGIIGPLTPAVSQELDVPALQAVAVGTHDTASAIAAVPAAGQSFAYIVCGTWSLLGTELSKPLLDHEVLKLQFSNEGGVGGTFQLLKNIMGLWILQECKRKWDEQGEKYSFPELIGMTAQVGPFRSLIHPDDPRFYSPADMEEQIRAFCYESNQPVPQSKGEITRCIIESLALRYRQALEQAELLTDTKFDGLHMVGGGSQNVMLCQLTANAIGKPVWAGPVEASAIGNILMQLVALGECRDVSEARQLVKTSFPITLYEPEAGTEWSQAYETFLGFRRI